MLASLACPLRSSDKLLDLKPCSMLLIHIGTFWGSIMGSRSNSYLESIGIKYIKCYFPWKICLQSNSTLPCCAFASVGYATTPQFHHSFFSLSHILNTGFPSSLLLRLFLLLCLLFYTLCIVPLLFLCLYLLLLPSIAMLWDNCYMQKPSQLLTKKLEEECISLRS